MCNPATRGIFIDLLCVMHERDRCGVISGTREQLARLGRCSTVELTSALDDLKTSRAANVTESGGAFTIISRRMRREHIARQRPALRSWISYRWRKLFVRLARRDGPACTGCGSGENLQIDHVVPIAKGGDNRLQNLQLPCGLCNQRKGARVG